MKFVCDNCQAKYQIGDDKVAGKTVRMKCRKCGFNIKVSAASVGAPTATAGAALPLGELGAGGAPIESMSSIGISAAEIGDDDATALMTQSVREAVVAASSPPSAPRPGLAGSTPSAASTASAGGPTGSPLAAPRPVPARPPSPGGIPRPASLGSPGLPRSSPKPLHEGPEGNIPRPSIGSPLLAGMAGAGLGGPARTPSGTMPRPAGVSGVAAASALSPAAPRPVTRTSTSSGSMAAVRIDAPHASHASHAAPQPHVAQAAQAPHASPASPASASEHEWYVGIAGTPIGPVRVSVIRERAAAHEVDGESLVWREGVSEWRPLKSYPELLSAVTEASGASASNGVTNGSAVARVASVAQVAPAAPAQVAPDAPVAPAAPVAPGAKPAPVVPVDAPPAVVAPAPVAVAAAAAPVPAAPFPPPAEVAPLAPPIALAAPTAPAAPSASSASTASTASSASTVPSAPEAPKAARAAVEKDDLASLEESLIPRRRGAAVHPMAYAFVAAAAVFGGVAAWVLLRPQPPPQIVFVQPPAPIAPIAPASAATVDKAGGGEAEVQVGDIATGSSATAAHPGVHSTGTGTAKTTATTAPSGTPVAAIDTSSFVSNVPGPAATGAAPPSGGGGLSAGEISSVVAQNQAIIKRKCWQPALESKAPGSPANARVVGSLVIGPSGNVDSASTSGGDSFPGLASCIQQRMKNWHFPPSGGTTPVQVPFVFAGQ